MDPEIVYAIYCHRAAHAGKPMPPRWDELPMPDQELFAGATSAMDQAMCQRFIAALRDEITSLKERAPGDVRADLLCLGLEQAIEVVGDLQLVHMAQSA